MRRVKFVLLLSFIILEAQAQYDLTYYLQDNAGVNHEIPTPEEILGYQIGKKHVSHEQMVGYMHTIASSSNRVSIQTYGYTYEQRPLLLLTISDPANLGRIETLRKQHLKLSSPDRADMISPEEQPVVIWMGYSVHGNEASGINASLMVAYYLAASRSKEIEEILRNTIILIDPSINPDGYSRFSQWVNQFRSKVTITDPFNLEHNEPWPGGRTNHYWFDLNRDWLLLQHPESKARIEKYHQWKPNIVTDHHEMGSNSTFFFQPGIPSRNNPNTPEETYRLTGKIAEYHAKALDRIGSLYYSKESFDDFYYGKGSTYPDVNGGVGILFEQASSRGHARMTDNGILEFPFAIRNQFTVSLSTIRAGYEMKNELLSHQQNFYYEAFEEARRDKVKAYVIDGRDDKLKEYYLLDLLSRHQIEIFRLKKDLTINDKHFKSGKSFIIPTEQEQYRLISSIFEFRTAFNDSLFYDVSSWNIPLAFDVSFSEITEKQYVTTLLGENIDRITRPAGNISGRGKYGYIFYWDQYAAPHALYRIQNNNIRARVAKQSFTTRKGEVFGPGSIFIPTKGQELPEDSIFQILSEVSYETGIDIFPVATGYTEQGINLGSPQITPLQKPEILLFVGEGVSSYDAGEVWHLLDQRFEMPVSLVTIDLFNRISLKQYNTIIMVNGNYSAVTEKAGEKLRQWLEEGGNIIAVEGAARWLNTNKMASITFKSTERDTVSLKKYDELSRDRGAQLISGTIFNTLLDLSHPLCYGYPDQELSVFKSSGYFFEKSKNPYNHPVLYTEDPLLSGYVSRENYKATKGSSAIIVTAAGRGRTICFSDNPNFRGFWFGTNRLFFNAIFFGDLISPGSAR